ncbi:phage portal protein [Bacillus badius]|uniref:phage portal protein n=1 Tax=Bacillus badius TaxID=1455 RepID=UPI0005ADE754|nr:phage portal protein [Bacillus badius]KIL74358.1 Portal protein, phage associated [Bacillus badius]
MGNTAVQNYIKKKLDKGEELTGKMIDRLIKDHASIKEKTWKSYQRYLATDAGVPIKTRKVPDYEKVNNKLNNDFVGEIINNKVSYFCGIPIGFEIDKNSYEQKPPSMMKKVFDTIVGMKNDRYKAHSDKMKEFMKLNNLADTLAEQTKLVSIAGHAGIELYIESQIIGTVATPHVRVANVAPWETIFITDSNNAVIYSLRYYQELDDNDKMITKVEFFDKDNVSYWIQSTDEKVQKENPYVLDIEYAKNPMQHVFPMCPIVKFRNNDEEQSDFEKIEPLIDGYDNTLSDINSEIEALRLAYLLFTGGKAPTKELMDKLKQVGALHNESESGKVGFLTKDINDAAVENHLNRIEKNINRFGQSIDFTSEDFAGNISGIAMKYKLMAIDNKCKTLENKFNTSLTQMMYLVCHVWNTQKVDLNYLDVFFTYKRNLPTDYLYEAQISTALKGNVSERTRLSLLSFVDDVDYELEQMKEDAEASIPTFTDPTTDVEDEFNIGNLEEGEDDEQAAV